MCDSLYIAPYVLIFMKAESNKGVHALRGYFGLPMRPKNENCFSQVSFY